MKKVLIQKINITFFVAAFFLGCRSNDDWEHLNTDRLGDNVYVEKFVNRGGVYEGNSVEYFITDSSTYRFSLGVCDDKEFFQIKIVGSKANVEKHSRRNMKNKTSNIIETVDYDLPN